MARTRRLLRRYPTFGYRRIWVLLRFREGIRLNPKAVYRHIPCGRDGWGQLAAVIDSHDREIVGWEFAFAAGPRRRNERSRKPVSVASGRFARGR